MVKKTFRWAVGLTLVAVVVSAVVRVFAGRSDTSTAPTIGGDTWPPVPLNPDRPV